MAPQPINPGFASLLEQLTRCGKQTIDRCDAAISRKPLVYIHSGYILDKDYIGCE